VTETIAVYLIVGIALVLSARWIYQTVAVLSFLKCRILIPVRRPVVLEDAIP
jgi:hypothetical protein